MNTLSETRIFNLYGLQTRPLLESPPGRIFVQTSFIKTPTIWMVKAVAMPPHSAYAKGKFKIPAPRAELTTSKAARQMGSPSTNSTCTCDLSSASCTLEVVSR